MGEQENSLPDRSVLPTSLTLDFGKTSQSGPTSRGRLQVNLGHVVALSAAQSIGDGNDMITGLAAAGVLLTVLAMRYSDVRDERKHHERMREKDLERERISLEIRKLELEERRLALEERRLEHLERMAQIGTERNKK